MSIIKSLANRRSYYDIDKNMPVLENEIEEKIKAVTALVPDAFNSKSARVVIVFGEKHDLLWDEIYNAFEGKLAREKVDSFKAGAGTIYKKNLATMQTTFLFGQIRQMECYSLLFGRP